MTFSMPFGTVVTVDPIARVTVQFRRQEDAERFADWLHWLDSAKDGQEMILKRKKEHSA